MSDYSALTDALDELLAHALDAHTDAGLTPPARSYVSAGTPAAECDLLAVYATPRAKENPGGPQRCVIFHQADITIHRWMCLEITEPIPGQTALDAVGHTFHDSMWATWFYLGALITRGDLHPGLGCDRAELLNTAQILDEEGGMAAWTIQVRIDLAPYTTPGPAS